MTLIEITAAAVVVVVDVVAAVVVIVVITVVVMIMMKIKLSSRNVSIREYCHVRIIQAGSHASRAIICNPIAVKSMG
jgi:hypothetical protein